MATPNETLIAYSRKYRDLNAKIGQFYFSKGKDLPEWHSSVFLPIAAWIAIVTDGGPVSLSSGTEAAELAAVGTWQFSKSIYEFDADIFETLIDAGINGEIPASVLLQIPEWCVYIKTPGLKYIHDDIAGFFAHLEHDMNTQAMELRIALHSEDGSLRTIPLILGQTTIEESCECLFRNAGFTGIQTENPLVDLLQKIIPLVLYLCTDAPEFKGSNSTAPSNAVPKKTKHGLKLFPVEKVRTWKVGYEIGNTIRAAHTRAGGKKSPHLRRAHWHHFWSGKRDSADRRIICKFLPPTFVGDQEN